MLLLRNSTKLLLTLVTVSQITLQNDKEASILGKGILLKGKGL
jgi:hypothetical protein